MNCTFDNDKVDAGRFGVRRRGCSNARVVASVLRGHVGQGEAAAGASLAPLRVHADGTEGLLLRHRPVAVVPHHRQASLARLDHARERDSGARLHELLVGTRQPHLQLRCNRGREIFKTKFSGILT